MNIQITERDKIILTILGVIVAIVLIYNFGYKNLKVYGEDLKDEVNSLERKLPDIASLTNERDFYDSQIAELNEKIERIKAEGGNGVINKQGLLQYVSDWANDFNVEVLRFKEVDSSESNGVWRTRYEIQLGGSLNDLVVITNKVDDLGISYNVLSMSLRQLMDHPWLKRGYEELSDLPWMSFEVEEGEDSLDTGFDFDGIDLIDDTVIDVPPTDGANYNQGSSGGSTDGSTSTDGGNIEKSIEEKLMILLGEDGTSERDNKEPVNSPSRNFVSRSATRSILGNVETTGNVETLINKYRLDMEIEFIMFRDPNTSTQDVVEYDEKEYFVIDSAGNKLSKLVIGNKITDMDFVGNEIERVEKEIENMESEGKDTTEIKKYLDYLKGI